MIAWIMLYSGYDRINPSLFFLPGLDPAGPAFERYSANVRLDKSDATFVDVIHTDAEPLMETGRCRKFLLFLVFAIFTLSLLSI